MIIVSQDKKAIHNFDNILSLQVEKKNCSEIDYTHSIIVYDNINDRSSLGDYKTTERAKEVLQEIIKKYEEDSYYKRRYIGEGCYSVNEVNHPIPKVYEMPEN